ncbi:MAG: lytic transglycosylase domain-containing protein [SAR324 cluster bacterium]|nr:lytic transglycosylase domain-containing protein [SAR324 cluster bacterium]
MGKSAFIGSLIVLILANCTHLTRADSFVAADYLKNDGFRLFQIEKFYQAKLDFKKKNYQKSCDLLEVIEIKKDSTKQLILYNKALCYWHLNDWQNFISASQDIKYPFIKNLIVKVIGASLAQKKHPKIFLTADINQLLKVFPELFANKKLISLYLKKLTASTDVNKLLKNLWFRSYSSNISSSLPKKLRTKFNRIVNQASLADWEKYFLIRLQKNRFSSLIKTAPPIIKKFKKQKKYPATLMKYYVQSLSAANHHTSLLNYLSKKENKTLFKFFPREIHSLYISSLVKKGYLEKAYKYANDLQASKVSHSTKGYVYLVLGNYLFFWKQDLKAALIVLNKINIKHIKIDDLEQLQWQKLFSAIITKNKPVTNKLYVWYKKHKFNSEALDSHFCYWIHNKANELIDIKEKSAINCYHQFSNQYYGLRSIVNNEFDYYKESLLKKSPLPLADKIPDKDTLQFIEFIRITTDFSEHRVAELFLKHDFSKSKDLGYLKTIADSFNQDKLYYLSQNLYFSVLKVKSLDKELFHLSFLESIYPLAFQKIVATTAKNFSVPVSLVYAIMREESHYNHLATSTVGATGLMQLMHGTAKQMSNQLKANIKKQDFNIPDNNILLGTYYLKKLLKTFDGHLVYTIAGYNAGPRNVKKWMKKYKTTDTDIFIEMIPFGETRRYVKKVLRSYFAYEIIYQHHD